MNNFFISLCAFLSVFVASAHAPFTSPRMDRVLGTSLSFGSRVHNPVGGPLGYFGGNIRY